MKEDQCGRKILERIVLTDEQRKILSKYMDKEIKELAVLRLGIDDVQRIIPGVISATIITPMCW